MTLTPALETHGIHLAVAGQELGGTQSVVRGGAGACVQVQVTSAVTLRFAVTLNA